MRIGPDKYNHCYCSCYDCTEYKQIKRRRKTTRKLKEFKFNWGIVKIHGTKV